MDVVFHALGDPTRRAIVDLLSHGPASVSELAGPLRISLPAVMQHLGLLQDSGLVSSTKTGRVRTCRIEPRAIGEAESWLAKRRAFWEERFDRLGELLSEQADEKSR
jgi:DNA-binding transcriptional ArsR family regulator